MSEKLFNINRLNRRIINLTGYLSQLSQNALAVVENNTEESAATLLSTLDAYSKGADSMVESLETLIRDITGQEDESGGIEVDVQAGEQGHQF